MHNATRQYERRGRWNCPCCNPYNCSPRKAKVIDRRYLRRKMKRLDKMALKEIAG